MTIVGVPKKGPEQLVLIEPITPRLRWWQFWRWPCRKEIESARYYEVETQMWRLFSSPYGSKADPQVAQAMLFYQEHNIPIQVVRVGGDGKVIDVPGVKTYEVN